MTDLPAFHVEVYHNEFLSAGGSTVEAVVTLTASGSAGHTTTAGPEAAHVIMIDCSGSMADPPTKMAEAKKATIAAIESLRAGVAFAVIAGRHAAEMVYPRTATLTSATEQTRAEAQSMVSQLTADGGTAVSTWLQLAGTLFARHPAEIKHAIMLTDGRNEHEPPEQLAAVLRACEGQFICDARGIGDDWSGTELRAVASALLGTADGLASAGDLVADFQAMTEAAMGKTLAEVSLRLWTPTGSTVHFVKEVFPHVEDLTGRRTEVSARIGDYPTGDWGVESRDYHIGIGISAGEVGEERLAARVALLGQDQTLVESRVKVTWSDDYALTAKINPMVAHYTGQAELAVAIQEGLAARAAGDIGTATAKLGRAVQLAAETGHADSAHLLSRIVDVIDARLGRVRLRTNVAGVDAELAIVRSVKTVRAMK